MANRHAELDPADPEHWARRLGMVAVPLFSPSVPARVRDDARVLLDGYPSSLVVVPGHDIHGDDLEPLWWTWSAHVRHTVIVDRDSAEIRLRHWDRPGASRRFRYTPTPDVPDALHEVLEQVQPAGLTDAITHVLGAFRAVRSIVAHPDCSVAVRLLNVLLACAASLARKGYDRREWAGLPTARAASEVLDAQERRLAGADEIPNGVMNKHLGALLSDLVDPVPGVGALLDADLLLRHAAGQLYQEAHLHIERDPQLQLAGIGQARATGAEVTHPAARFTPVSLARLLVQKTLDVAEEAICAKREIAILDPACGSGVFLQEAVRELLARGWRGRVLLHGIDLSPVSRVMAEFCLMRLVRETKASGMTVEPRIQRADALSTDWPAADLVLMNPPFVAWTALSQAERFLVKQALGPAYRGRADMAMAFVSRALAALNHGGVLASVLPASALSADAGRLWRGELAERTTRHLLGRFRGYGYFRGSGATVEPGFVVLQEGSERSGAQIPVVTAEPGAEDAAIRGARRFAGGPPLSGPGWEVYEAEAATLPAVSWAPRPRSEFRVVEAMRDSRMSRVGELFRVLQGVKTGHNRAFVLSAREHSSLPRREREWFRPVAGTTTIRHGRLSSSRYLFYPYGPNGLRLLDEDALRAAVPRYYDGWLAPARDALVSRAKSDTERWWKLVWERRWMWEAAPKLVSAAFGLPGCFAYDDTGEYAVLQGFAWLWQPRARETRDAAADFPAWAYLALLNSRVFGEALSLCCPQVQGGQYELTAKYANAVYLPDLTDGDRALGEVVAALARVGRDMHRGVAYGESELEMLARRAYGVPTA